MACLTGYHGFSDAGDRRVLTLHRLGEDRLVEQFGGVGMHQISAAFAQQHTVGMWVRLGLADGGCEPVEADVDGEGAHDASLGIVDGLAIAREDILDDDTFLGVFKEGLNPIRFVKQFGNQIPVHREVLVIVGSFLFGLDGVTVVIGIGREVAPLILEVIRLEADAAACQVGIALEHLSAEVEHEVGFVEMVLDDHQHVVGSHLGTMKRVVDMEHSTLDGLRGLVPSLLAHHLARLRKHQGEGCGEDGCHEYDHPEA